MDLRNAAGFVRHPGALVTNFLLPVRTLNLSQKTECPKAVENRQIMRFIMAARKIALYYRMVLRRRKVGKFNNNKLIMITY